MTNLANRKQWLIFAAIAVFFTVCIVIYSEEAFNSAVAGLKIWWDVVFPALLPFFILSELLMGLGVVHAIGALLEPMMRPVFRVPGVGAFAFAMGLASGYPIGAKITGDLRRKKLCSRIEGERLVSFTNTADPLFMVGAVAVGMFSNAAIGMALVGAHYISAIMLGLVMRFYGRKEESEQGIEDIPRRKGNIFIHAIEDLLDAREKDGRAFGELLGDSIWGSVKTLLLIGGYIILFSVITKILLKIGIITIMTKIIMFILSPFGIAESMVLPILGGFFEITNGADLAAHAVAPLFQRVAICSAIIAWSGLSVHAQVATMVQGTDIRVGSYIWARVLHSFLAAACTYLFLSPSMDTLVPVHLPVFYSKSFLTLGYFDRFGYMFNNFMQIICFFIAISLVLAVLQRIRIIVLRYRE